jgi:RNA 2',3'-cyclic 3'-phosphodiesterase
VRAFVAVDVEEPGRETDAAAPRHITLRFLGEVAPSRVPALADAMERVGREVAPFDLRLEGIGAFPTAEAPRVVWVGVAEGRAELTALAARTRAALEGEGSAPPEREFVPHLTLLRVRTPSDRRAARDLLAGRRPVPPVRSVRIHEIVLKESELRPGGAVHRTLVATPLRGDEASA